MKKRKISLSLRLIMSLICVSVIPITYIFLNKGSYEIEKSNAFFIVMYSFVAFIIIFGYFSNCTIKDNTYSEKEKDKRFDNILQMYEGKEIRKYSGKEIEILESEYEYLKRAEEHFGNNDNYKRI